MLEISWEIIAKVSLFTTLVALGVACGLGYKLRESQARMAKYDRLVPKLVQDAVALDRAQGSLARVTEAV